MLRSWRRECLKVFLRHPVTSCAKRKLSASPALYYAASRSATVQMEDYPCDVIRCAIRYYLPEWYSSYKPFRNFSIIAHIGTYVLHIPLIVLMSMSDHGKSTLADRYVSRAVRLYVTYISFQIAGSALTPLRISSHVLTLPEAHRND